MGQISAPESLLPNYAATYVFADDFIFAVNTTFSYWNVIVSGGTVSQLVTENGALGLYGLRRGTTAANRAAEVMRENIWAAGDGEIFIEWRWRIPILSTGVERFGFNVGLTSSATTATPTAGVYFRVQDDENGGNYQAITRNAGATVTVNGTIAPVANKWTLGQIYINALGTQASFYIDGVLLGTCVGEIPPNGATGVQLSSNLFGVLGTTNREVHIDWVKVQKNFSPGRSG